MENSEEFHLNSSLTGLAQLWNFKPARKPDLLAIFDEHSLVTNCKKKPGKRSVNKISVKGSNYTPEEGETILFELIKTKHENFNGHEFFVIKAREPIEICRDYDILKLKNGDKGMILFTEDKIKILDPKREFTFRDCCNPLNMYQNELYQIIDNRFISFEDRPIAKGMTAQVRKVVDVLEPHGKVALKTFDFTSEENKENFLPSSRREIEALRRLRQIGDHQNIVKLIDVYESSDKTILVLECMDRDLVEELKTPESDMEEIDALRQILTGLCHLHESGISHNDVKPDNILVKRLSDGRVIYKICDLGTAHMSGSIIPWELCCTFQYASPETLKIFDKNENVPETFDHFAADMFSFGVLAFALLTRCCPFETDENKIDPNHLAANFQKIEKQKLKEFKKSSSYAQQSFIKRCMNLNPLERPTASEAREDESFRGCSTRALDSNSQVEMAHQHQFKIFPKVTTRRRSTRIAALQTRAMTRQNREIPFCQRRNVLSTMVSTTKGKKRRSCSRRCNSVNIVVQHPKPYPYPHFKV